MGQPRQPVPQSSSAMPAHADCMPCHAMPSSYLLLPLTCCCLSTPCSDCPIRRALSDFQLDSLSAAGSYQQQRGAYQQVCARGSRAAIDDRSTMLCMWVRWEV